MFAVRFSFTEVANQMVSQLEVNWHYSVFISFAGVNENLICSQIDIDKFKLAKFIGAKPSKNRRGEQCDIVQRINVILIIAGGERVGNNSFGVLF